MQKREELDKKVVVAVVGGVLLIAGIAFFFMYKDIDTDPDDFIVEDYVIDREEKLETSVGYSTLSGDKSEEDVIEDAFNNMMDGLEGNPDFVVLTSSVGFDQKNVAETAFELLPVETKLYGYTSLFGLMSEDGFITGEGREEGGVIGMMGFTGEDIKVGTGIASLDEREERGEVAKLALDRAMEDVEDEDFEPSLVMMSSAPFGAGEDLFVKEVESVVGTDTPIAGGGAAAGYADLVSGGQAIFSDGESREDGVSIAVLDIGTSVGHAFMGGFDPVGPTGEVTDIERTEEGIKLNTIDGEPAAQVYNDWLDGELDNYLGTSQMFIHKTVYHTLGLRVEEEDGKENWHMIAALHFNPDDSITLGTTIEEGSKIHLLGSNAQGITERLEHAVRLARGRGGLPERDIAGVLVDQCGASLLGMPERDDWDEMIDMVSEAIGDAPFMGASNLGPYGHFSGVGSRYGEVTPSVLIFGKY